LEKLQALLVNKALKGIKVLLDYQVKMETRAAQDHLVKMAQMVFKVFKDHLVLQAQLVLLVLMDLLVILDIKANRAKWDPWDQLDLWAIKV
jgi:hypothetical protein